jgi:hypothetical protein
MHPRKDFWILRMSAELQHLRSGASSAAIHLVAKQRQSRSKSIVLHMPKLYP